MNNLNQTRRSAILLNWLCLACVGLVLFIGVVQAVHVHSADSKIPAHECSICSVAHSGMAISRAPRPLPVFTSAVLVQTADPTFKSFGFTAVLRIRPPPSV